MSDQNAETTEAALPSEMDQLKARAKLIGLQFHPSIGVDTLREKVNAFLKTGGGAPPEVQLPEVAIPKEESQLQMKSRLRQEATRLVRIQVACMNPNKKEWDGEIFTASNGVVGSHKKFVPFNIEAGWHVPQIILNVMKDRKCQIFYNAKGPRGIKIRKGKLIPEFSIVEMPPLTVLEMDALKAQQAAGNNLD